MAPRGAGAAKKQAGAKANPKGAPGSNLSAVDAELDESRFASLTTDMCLPHYFGRKTPLEIPKPEPQEMLANSPAGLFVDKGQAGPSVIQPSPAAPSMAESAWPEAAAGHDQADDGGLLAFRDEVEALRAALTERDAALAELHAAGVQAHETWTQEAEDWFREAEEAWKAGEAARLAAAEAEWREQSTIALAQARSEAETARTETEDELRRAREESIALKATLNERDAALAEMRAAGEQTRAGSANAQDLLREAEQAWKLGEAERLKAAEAKWQEQSAAELAQARSETEAAFRDTDTARNEIAAARDEAKTARNEAEAARNQVEDELRLAREESAVLKAALTERDTALAEMRAAGEQARESQTQAQDALREAEQTWKTGEEARLAAAEAKWRENSISALTRVRTEAQAARTQSDDELRRMREETAALKASLAEDGVALKATLAERDTQLAEMQLAAEREAATLAKAQASWKADESARFAASEAQWRKQAASAIADATARYEAAEGALAQLRQDATRERSSAKIELTQTRSAMPAERRSRRGSGKDDDAPRKKHTVRDVLVVAALAASVIVFYPNIAPYLPQSVRSNLATVTAGIGPINTGFSTSSAALPDGAAHAVVARDVNLRASPAAAGKIVTTLARGVKVTTLEKKGNWTSVQVESDKPDAKPVQGWVFNSFLKDEGAGEDTE